MRRDNVRSAMFVRDDGLRKISLLTWRTGAVAAVAAALIAVAFGHGVRQTPAQTQPSHQAPGTIVIPAQPPAPAQGSGQVTSGAS
jgi:hypothetical protein